MAAATAESTPPDKPQMTLLSPITCLALVTSVCAMFPVVHVASHFAVFTNQLRNIAWPCSLCKTSG